MIQTLKQFCNICTPISDTMDWLALADAYEEAGNENATNCIRDLIIPFLKYKSKKIPDFDGELYTWQSYLNKPSKIEIYKYLPSARYVSFVFYISEEEAYLDLWMAFLVYVSERNISIKSQPIIF